MKKRKATPRAEGAALPRRRAGRSTDKRAAGPTRVLKNSCKPSQEDQGSSWEGPADGSCNAAENEGLVFITAYSPTTAELSPQSGLSTVISTLKEMVTLKKRRFFTILFLMSLAALASAYFGTVMLMWMLQGTNVSQILLGQPEADRSPQRNALSVGREQAQNVQQLRDEVLSLVAVIRAMREEVQQLREAVSASTGMSNGALKSRDAERPHIQAGAAIELQRSSSIPAWFCSVFGFLGVPPVLDSFVQPASSPGHCWPFRRSRSEVLIRLPTQIQPVAITVQHASEMASALETVSSAPRDFAVSGLDEEGEDETLLGTFTYAVQNKLTQTFALQNGICGAFRVLKLTIESNWGAPGCTCIYRVQVHGKTRGENGASQTHFPP